MLSLDDPLKNHLLAALPADEYARISPHLERVPLPLGHVLYESGHELRHVYFPTDSIVSLLYVMLNGASAEISVVGNEGLVGIAVFMGGESTPSRSIVQSGGTVFRLAAADLVRSAGRALARTAGALLLPGLLAAAGDERAVLHRHRAGAAIDVLHLRSLIEKVRVGLGAEHVIRELNLGDLLVGQIYDVELGHGVLSS